MTKPPTPPTEEWREEMENNIHYELYNFVKKDLNIKDNKNQKECRIMLVNTIMTFIEKALDKQREELLKKIEKEFKRRDKTTPTIQHFDEYFGVQTFKTKEETYWRLDGIKKILSKFIN